MKQPAPIAAHESEGGYQSITQGHGWMIKGNIVQQTEIDLYNCD